MRYVAAYLLALLGGNKAPSKDDLEKILGSVGIECDAEKVKVVLEQLKGKDVEKLINEGQSKLASVPAGGGAAVAAPAAGGGGGAAPAAAGGAAKKEEKKEESEEEDDDMGFGLFD